MKYTEFTQLMENKGLKVEDDGQVIIVKENFYPVAKVYKDTTESYALNFSQFDEQSRKLRRFIAQACHELAFTDLDDREEEKLYYLVNKYKLYGEKIYFTFNMKYAENLSTYKDIKNRDRATFTQKEIDALDLSKDWEQVEVE